LCYDIDYGSYSGEVRIENVSGFLVGSFGMDIGLNADGSKVYAASSNLNGTTDFWVYNGDGTLRISSDISGLNDTILDRRLAVSGDGVVAIVAVDTAGDLVFITMFP
jgi:DNA-binding beta-propeller fold protein YncE